MELKILEERPNPLLKRVEYRFEVDHATQGTPSRDEVRGELAKAVKTPKDRVVVEEMHARYGTAHTLGRAAAYQSTAALQAVVRDHIQVRNGLKEKAAKTPAAPTEAPAKPAAEVAAPAEKAEAKAETKPAEKPKSAPKATEKADAKPAEKEKADAKPAEKAADKPARKSSAKAAEPAAKAE